MNLIGQFFLVGSSGYLHGTGLIPGKAFDGKQYSSLEFSSRFN